MKNFNRAEIAAMMDQAVLKPDASAADIIENATRCRELGIGCLCVRPSDARLAAENLRGSNVRLAVVIGFPHGASHAEVKRLEAKLAIEDGADELDLVMNLGQFKSGNVEYVKDDIAGVVNAARPTGATVKVIVESGLLTHAELTRACTLAIAAGAQFVKTSTGFNGIGATPDAVTTMLKACAGSGVKVKASGGIRSWTDAVRYAELGVARLGVSAGPAILAQAPEPQL